MPQAPTKKYSKQEIASMKRALKLPISPVKKYSKKEKASLLSEAFSGYVSADDPKEKDRIVKTMYKNIGFSDKVTPEEVKKFFDEQVVQMNEPSISALKGKEKNVPQAFLNKMLKLTATPDVTGGIAPPESKEYAERALRALKGNERSKYEAFQEATQMLESASPAGSASARVRKGKTVRLGRKYGKRSKTRLTPKQRETMVFAAKKLKGKGKKGKKGKKQLAPVINKYIGGKEKEVEPASKPTLSEEPWVKKEPGLMKGLQKRIDATNEGKEAQPFGAAPVVFIKHFYKDTTNLSDAEAAKVLVKRINAKRPKKKHITIEDLTEQVTFKFEKSGDNLGYFKPQGNLLVINTTSPINTILETISHELTHAYDKKNLLKEMKSQRRVDNNLWDAMQGKPMSRVRQKSARRIYKKMFDRHHGLWKGRMPESKIDTFEKQFNLVKENKPEYQDLKEIYSQPQSRIAKYKATTQPAGIPQRQKDYLTTRAEIGPSSWAPMRRYAAQKGHTFETGADVIKFITEETSTPKKREELYNFINRSKGMSDPRDWPFMNEPGAENDQLMKVLLKKGREGQNIRREMLKWVKSDTKKDTQVA